MDFGKLHDISQVNFSLPPEPPQNRELLQSLSPTPSKPTIYIGATGYNMKQWVGKWYPGGAKDKDFPRHYGQQFNTIEHNTTHYRIPDAATVARWRDEVPTDFRYCPKLPQTISHARDLGFYSGQLREFYENIAGLRDRLGPCFLQMPPYFAVNQWRMLDTFFEKWPRQLPLAVEVRHESFFDGSAVADAFFQMLAGWNASAVVTDVAGRRDVCHMRLTSGQVLVRFVGNGLHETDFSRIREWAVRLKNWLDSGLREAYFFTHEPDNLLAPELAVFAGETFAAAMPEVALRWPREIQRVVQGALF